MDLSFDDAQEALRQVTRGFLERQAPVTGLRAVLESEMTWDPAIWRQGADLGWAGLAVPTEHGGSGGGMIELLVIAEEFGRGLLPSPFIGTQVLTLALLESGSPAQPAGLLSEIVRGDATGAWSFYEAGRQWTGDAVAMRASPSGYGWRLDGSKMFVQDASTVSHLLVTARLGGELAQFVLPSHLPGITTDTLHTLDLSRRYHRVDFDGVAVPADALLGEPGAATEALVEAQRRLAIVLLCADAVGAATRVVEMTVEYAKQREQFGRPIGSFQAIKHKCANLLLWSEAARAATYAAALHVHAMSSEAAEAVAVAKAACGEWLLMLGSEALQCHGGIGMTWEHDLHLYMRRIRAADALFGNSLWHQERIAVMIGV